MVSLAPGFSPVLRAHGDAAALAAYQRPHLTVGDPFELERLTSGRYLLSRQPPAGARFTVATAEDGLPVIHPENGTITSRMVKNIESQTP